MSKDNKFKDDAIESLVGWMENLEGTPSDQLRAIRHDLGHDVEESERQFHVMLTEKSRALGIELEPLVDSQPTESLEGLLKVAKGHGFSNTRQFADATGLSPVLVTMLDRGLITFSSIPPIILDKVASTIKCTSETLSRYLQMGPRLALGANYKAEESPATEAPQDFFEAILTDPSLSEERRAQLLSLRG